MSISLDWSTVVAKSPSELMDITDKSPLIDLFMSHVPEVSSDIRLLSKLILLLDAIPEAQLKVEKVFSKVIRFESSHFYINLKTVGTPLSLADLNGETLLTFAVQYCDLETVKELLESESLKKCNSSGNTPLLTAVRVGRFDAVKALLKKKGDPNLTDSEACAAIALACKGNDPKILDILLTKDNINLPLENGEMPPLWCAAVAGNEQFIDLIIEKGGDIRARDRQGNTLLLLATNLDFAHQGSSIVRCLIKHGADIREEGVISGVSGITAFFSACYAGRVDCLDLLFFPEVLDRFLGDKISSPLITAASNGHLSVVEFLIKKGAQANNENDNGRTALHFACKAGHLEIVKFLVKDAGSDINHAVKVTKYTPLIEALKNKKFEVAKYLISQEAWKDLEDENGSRALHWACSVGTLEIVTMLLNKDVEAKINRRTALGYTPLYFATANNQLEIARHLVGLGADQSGLASPFHTACEHGSLELVQLFFPHDASSDMLEFAPQKGVLPIVCASANRDVRVMRYLIERGASPNSTNPHGLNVLHMACCFGNLKLVEFLLEKFPSMINSANKEGYTSLHIATNYNNPQIVKFLLDQKADLSIRSSEGMTALDRAIKLKHFDVVELLLDAQKPLLQSSQGIIEKIKAYSSLLKYEGLEEVRVVPNILETIMREYYTKRELQNFADALYAELSASRIDSSQFNSLVKKANDFLGDLNLYVVPFFSYFYKDFKENELDAHRTVSVALEGMLKRMEFKMTGLDAIFSSWIKEHREGCHERQSLDEVYQAVFEASRGEVLAVLSQTDLDNEIEFLSGKEPLFKGKLLAAVDRKIAQDPIATGHLKACRDRIGGAGRELVEAEQYFNVAVLKYKLSKNRAHPPAKRQKAEIN